MQHTDDVSNPREVADGADSDSAPAGTSSEAGSSDAAFGMTDPDTGGGAAASDTEAGRELADGTDAGGPELAEAGASDVGLTYEDAFQVTLYPVLSAACGECHSSEGQGVWPLIADADPQIAAEASYPLLSLNSPPSSHLVRVVSVEEHVCEGSCPADAAALSDAIEQLSAQSPAALLERRLEPYADGLSEAALLDLIEADRAEIPDAELPYVRYISLHQLNNAVDWGSLTTPWAALDRLNAARVAVGLVLNSSARHARALAHPVPIDPAAQVLRINIVDYWGFDPEGNADTAQALSTWERITEGNAETADESAQEASTYPNNSAFHDAYVDADQLAYTLTRPDVYTAVMQLPETATELERELGVVWDLAPGEAQFLVVPRSITGNTRLVGRAASRDGAYWRTTDQMDEAPFIFYERPIPEFVDPAQPSQLITTALYPDGTVAPSYSCETGPQAHISFVAFSLPNGLLGFAVFGPSNQRLTMVAPDTLRDPWRGYGGTVEASTLPFTLVGESCLNCHQFGLRGALDYLHPRLGEIVDGEQLEVAEALYPGAEATTQQFWADGASFWDARASIVESASRGMLEPSATENGLLLLLQSARERLGYSVTSGN